jgi:putative nucleotidyltransferase with HDIG domain
MARVLIVDDEGGIRVSLGAFLRNDGHEVRLAEDVMTAMGILETFDADVVVSDIIMPGESGVQLLARIRERDPSISVVLLTGDPSVQSASEAVRHGAFDYLTKPVTKAALLAVVTKAARAKAQHDLNVRLTAENEGYRQDLEGLVEERTAQLAAALRGTIGVVAKTLEIRDPYTAGHQRRVASLALAVATEMGLPDATRVAIEMAALVHDVGKIGVPAEILSKPTRLLSSEFNLIKEHPRIGYGILQGVEFPWPVADIIVQHHERLDGSGYPDGLKGDAIGLEARIISVADVVEAMASHRPYRPALGIDAALAEISSKRGKLYDEVAVDACVRLFSHKNFQLIPASAT